MTQKIIYLAGPIFNCADGECIDWRLSFKEALSWKYRFLDPMRRDYRGQQLAHLPIAEEVVVGDKEDVISSDIVLANCHKPSSGTAMEIMFTWMFFKPIYVIVPDYPNISPWIAYHASILFCSVDQAIEHLRNLP